MKRRTMTVKPLRNGNSRADGGGSQMRTAAAKSKAATRSLSDVAYEKLIYMIRDGELRPNDLIIETHLSRKLKISRTPLREAIRRLEGEKILEKQRSGTLVVKTMSLEDLLHVWQIRHLLEGDAARRAAGQIPAQALKSLREQILTIKNTKNPAANDLRGAGRDLHTLIARASGNPLLASIIEDFRKRTQLLTIRRLPERIIKMCEEHIAIIDALLTGDGDESRAAMQKHIEGVRVYTLSKLGAL